MLPPPAVLAESFAVATLRDSAPAWPRDAGDEVARDLVKLATDNGVCALLHDKLAGSDWPQDLVATLRERALRAAMWELSHQHALDRLLEAFHARGITPVLIKGTSLAYSTYANPALRTRGDTDLLIPPSVRAQADGILRSLGYETRPAVEGEYISYQAAYHLHSGDGAEHTVDLHWKINNSQVLARLFTHEELLAQAQALPRLAEHAWGASPVHALLIACMHRCTHRQNPYYVDGEAHHDADRLIWLYDIHLLANGFSPDEWNHFAQLALRKGLGAVCLEGLSHSRSRFGTGWPPDVEQALSRPAGEAPARYLASGKLRQQWMDFKALGSRTRRLRFVRELLFPAPGYMRAKYAGAGSTWLPWLYLRRAAEGAFKTIARRHAA